MNYKEERMSGEFTKYILHFEGKNGGFYPAIHHFTAPDIGGPHDHPWDFTSYILKGSYIEKVYYQDEDGNFNSKEILRKAGDVIHLKAEHIHEIVALPDGECFTLVIAQPERRKEGFWDFSGDTPKFTLHERHKKEI